MSEVQTVKKRTAPKQQKKKSTKRKLTPFTRLICFVVILFSMYLLYRVAAEVYTTITLKRQLGSGREIPAGAR